MYFVHSTVLHITHTQRRRAPSLRLRCPPGSSTFQQPKREKRQETAAPGASAGSIKIPLCSRLKRFWGRRRRRLRVEGEQREGRPNPTRLIQSTIQSIRLRLLHQISAPLSLSLSLSLRVQPRGAKTGHFSARMHDSCAGAMLAQGFPQGFPWSLQG
jgi:hypothetical protein